MRYLNTAYCSDVDTVSLEFEAPPEALQVSHLRMRPVKAQQKQKGRQYKGTYSYAMAIAA